MESTQFAINPTLESLESASTTELRAVYMQVLGMPPPQRASSDFLLGNIAWAIQANQLNITPEPLRKELIKKAIRPTHPSTNGYKPGTRLVREWQGRTYEVTILDKGYRWQEKTYRSLSHIAQEITGTHWSGPRFFGIARVGS